jgi:uncharacterized protein (TIGR02217 family)
VKVLFELTKTYADAGGATKRRIEKPAEGSVVLAVGGLALDPGSTRSITPPALSRSRPDRFRRPARL